MIYMQNICHKGKQILLIKHKIKAQKSQLLVFLENFHYICTLE